METNFAKRINEQFNLVLRTFASLHSQVTQIKEESVVMQEQMNGLRNDFNAQT